MYFRERCELWEDGFTTVAVIQVLLSEMPLVLFLKNSTSGTVYFLNQDNPMSNCPVPYASLHAISPT